MRQHTGYSKELKSDQLSIETSRASKKLAERNLMDHHNEHLFRYWGKADPAYPGEPKWHPLVYHSLDVAACGQTLLEGQHAWLETLCRLSGMPVGTLKPWLVFLLAIHDIGKFGDGFQSRCPDWMKHLQGRVANVPHDARHDTIGYELAMARLPEWLGRSDLGQRGGSLLRPWLSAVTGHHGKPPRSDRNNALLLRNQFPSHVLEDAKNFVGDTATLLMANGCPLPETRNGSSEAFKRTSWLLAGLAVAADWLGSNTRWFPYRKPDLGLVEYWEQIAVPTAQLAVHESGLASPSIAQFMGIRSLFDIEPTSLQSWADTAPIADGPQIFVLEELTGGGKTEAALTLSARLTAAGRGQGVYVALPTMATADAMFDRVRKSGVWKRLFAMDDPQLVLAHSADWLKLRLEEVNRRDAGYGRDEEPSASRNCTAWLSDSRKKALLADFGVGTIDQALLSVLPVRHQSLRLLGLSTKVLVVDEIHACDAYTGELLERLLQFHAAMGGSAVLLSATLPQSQRTRYLKAFASGAGFAARTAESMAYPLATHLHADGLKEQVITARAEVSRRVAVDTVHDEDAVLQRLFGTISHGGCAVWIRNTVVDALDAWCKWNALHPDCPAMLFHARFALADRLQIGAAVLRDFGPDSDSTTRAGKLVIATQVVEQSLDVDFDDMVTDLAPIDLIIQRAGRLQRHVRDTQGNRLQEKEAHDERGGACLGVFMPNPEDEIKKSWLTSLLPRAARVYPDHGQLWLTASWLVNNGGFDLPGQAREMIETVYGDAAFDAIPEALRPVADNADGSRRADRATARGTELVFEQGYDPTSLQWDDDADAPTRLGEKTARIRLARAVEERLEPWARKDPRVDWALSELTVPRRLIAKESDRYAEIIEQAKTSMADEGRYCLVVPLTAMDKGNWRGHAMNLQGNEIKEITVIYSPETGLSIEKGAEDESD
ncbi:MAG: CRISPR-associated helicase Cas3' [Sulfuricaulis sp.]|uniref:CRISPR-associated helicase Cas3' n=1 Tax=Sulfuricaulis sp. TaxID=2003553 RepID=UPI0034A35FE2